MIHPVEYTYMYSMCLHTYDVSRRVGKGRGDARGGCAMGYGERQSSMLFQLKIRT